MKQHNKVKKLQKRIQAYENLENKKGYRKPGSVKK
jgi:hypothetical protein